MAVRMNILLDDKHKKRLKKLATQINDSESAVIRRALEAFDPAGEQQAEEIGLLLQALKDANQKAHAALARAENEIAQTLAYYGEREGKHASKKARRA